ncbi:MAG: hypothetical protein GX605_01060 [Chloroflexi bacterium]|nr:hypothetical protein [Chloroflexota bacterium]
MRRTLCLLVCTVIALLGGSVGAAAQSPTNLGVVASSDSGAATVFDLSSGAVVATIPTGSQPVGVAISRDNRLALVTDPVDRTVTRINLAASPPVAAGSFSTATAVQAPQGLAITPDGRYVLLAHAVITGSLTSWDVSSGALVSQAPLTGRADGVALTPDGALALVNDIAGSQISLTTVGTDGVLTDTGARLTLTGGGGAPDPVVVHPSGQRALVGDGSGSGLWVLQISGTTVTSLGYLDLGLTVHGLAFSPDGAKAYAYGSSAAQAAVLAIDGSLNVTDTGTRVTLPAAASSFHGVAAAAWLADGSRSLFSTASGNQVRAVDSATDAVPPWVVAAAGPAGLDVTHPAGPAAQIMYLSGNNQEGTLGMPLPMPLRVRVVDGRGIPVTNQRVDWSIVGAPPGAVGQVLSATRTQTDAQGIAWVSLTLGDRPGIYSVNAAAGLAGSPVRFSATATDRPACIVKRVSQSGDDSFVQGDATLYDLSYVRLGGRDAGFRFIVTQIPQGSRITEATLSFAADGAATMPITVTLHAEDADQSQAFTFQHPLLNTRPRSEAQVVWPLVASWGNGQWVTSPDIAELVQEVVDRPGWRANNALSLLLIGHHEVVPYRDVVSFDAAASQAARLDVCFIPPWAFTPTPTPTYTPTATATPTATPTPTATATPTPTATATSVVSQGWVVGRVWEDLDQDGEPEEGERPLAGVRVTLDGSGPRAAAGTLETWSGEDGRYAFAGVEPGTHTVAVDLLAGHFATTAPSREITVPPNLPTEVNFGMRPFYTVWAPYVLQRMPPIFWQNLPLLLQQR